MKTARLVSAADLSVIAQACITLRDTRDALKRVGAKAAARYVGRALKSAEGASRHAEGVFARRRRPGV